MLTYDVHMEWSHVMVMCIVLSFDVSMCLFLCMKERKGHVADKAAGCAALSEHMS